MNDERDDREMVLCPVGRFFRDLGAGGDPSSPFHTHLRNSRTEFLKALRALLDDAIDHGEKRARPRDQERPGATRIEVD